MADLTLQQLCDLGSSNGTPQTIADGFAYENKIYTHKDAEEIERAGFKRTQVFQSTALGGSVDQLGNEYAPQIATIKMGLKAGMKLPLYSESYKAEWQGEQDGWLANGCTFAPKAMKRVIEIDRTLCTKKMFVATDMCYSEIIETRKQDLLQAGAIKEDQSDFLNQVVLNTFIETHRVNIDTHAFQGDYGSPIKDITYVDGWTKTLVQAVGTSQGQIVEFNFAGDLTDLGIMGMLGGEAIHHDYDTNSDTTVSTFKDFLLTKKEYRKGRSLFKSVTLSGSRTVVVEAWEGYVVVMDVVLGTIADSFYKCPTQHRIVANTPPSDASTKTTVTQTQKAITSYSPLAVNLQAVRSDNVVGLFDDFRDYITNTDSSMVKPDFGANFLVSTNVYASYERAMHNHVRSKHYSGTSGAENLATMSYMGWKLVACNYMQDNMYMLARPKDLLIGVDLVHDIEDFETKKVDMTSRVRFKGATSIGFQVRRVDKIAGTFCDPTNSILVYGDAMDCSILRTRDVPAPS